jgi:hypothetical protein
MVYRCQQNEPFIPKDFEGMVWPLHLVQLFRLYYHQSVLELGKQKM